MFSKTLTIAALAAVSAAQIQLTPRAAPLPFNLTFVEGLAEFLGKMGFTSIATAVTLGMNSPGGLDFLTNIQGNSKTLLVPNNAAFATFNKAFPNSNNPSFVGDVLSYHLIDGIFNDSSAFSTAPDHTVARTALNDSASTQLEGGLSQAMVFSVEVEVIHILNQKTNATVTGSLSFQNLPIQIIDTVIDIPGNFSTAIGANNLTGASTVFSQVNLIVPIQAANGLTIFVPSDTAFANVQSTLTSLSASNLTAVQNAVSNHVINGTTIYSTQLGAISAVSIAGEPFTFASNSSGTFVTSGSTTASVLVADIVLSNGVMHIIDTVFLNTNANAAAAAAAFSSAVSVAATEAAVVPTAALAAVAITTTLSSSSLATTSTSASSHAVPTFPVVNALRAIAVLVGVYVGAAVLI
ncbi:hypothetical protein FRB97_005093 [Tulasnella sp. 331]|nr:hypothetical protein FRB97_005093 [Tulasnella sp. 331]